MFLSPLLRYRFFDANGLPLAGGLLYTYQAGTLVPQVTYSNSIATPNANPVVLDASGYCDVWIDPTLSYKFVLKDSGGSTLWTVDNVSSPLSVSTWSANTSYPQGGIVQDSSGFGLFYVSLIANNLNNALTSVSSWRVLFGNVRTLSSNTSLLVTDDLIRSNSTAGALTHTLPACATTPAGKRIIVKDIGSGGYATTVKGAGGDLVDGNNVFARTLSQYAAYTFENNGSSWDVISTMLGTSSVIASDIAANAVTQDKLALRATGSPVAAAGGVAQSLSCGIFSTTSQTFTGVTNLSVTITTLGRPVRLALQSDGLPGSGELVTSQATATDQARSYIAFSRAVNTTFAQETWGTANGSGTPSLSIPAASFSYLDFPAAGTYTYTVVVASIAVGVVTTSVVNAVLVAYEI